MRKKVTVKNLLTVHHKPLSLLANDMVGGLYIMTTSIFVET